MQMFFTYLTTILFAIRKTSLFFEEKIILGSNTSARDQPKYNNTKGKYPVIICYE